MRVTLVNLPIRVDPRNIASGIATPPLWAAYLAASARRAGHDVCVVDAAGLALDQRFDLPGAGSYRGLTAGQVAAQIPADTQVIGLSCMFSSSWPLARFVLRELSQSFPDALLLAGGEHPTALPRTALTETPACAVVLGEGEETFLALLAHLPQTGGGLGPVSFTGVAGVMWRDENGGIHDEGRRARLRQLDDLPWPDWRDIPVENYMQAASGVGANRGPFMPLLATRGCPHQCTFCASPAMWTTRYYLRDPADVAREMAHDHHHFGATDFQFADLTAIVSRQWSLALCREIKTLNLPLTWQLPSGTRSEVIDAELAAALAASGCTNLAFALESGDPAMLSQSQKKLSTQKQLAAARCLIGQGLRVSGFFIVGFPYDTPEKTWRTLALIARSALLGFSEINVSAYAPVPGTKDFDRLVDENRLVVDDAYYHRLFHWLTLGGQTSFSPHLGTARLRLLVLMAYGLFFALSFLRRPSRLWVELRALLTGAGDQGKLAKVLRGRRTLKRLKPA